MSLSRKKILLILNFGIYGRYSTWRKGSRNKLLLIFLHGGTVLNNTIIRKRFKESNRKCSEITEERSLFCSENIKNIKTSDVAFPDKKKIIAVTILSSFSIDFRCFLRRLLPVFEPCHLSLPPLGRHHISRLFILIFSHQTGCDYGHLFTA